MATKSETLSTAASAAEQGKPQPQNATALRKTKKERLEALLRRKGGASLSALQKELGWQPHTVRAAVSGVRRASETVERVSGKSGPIYRIVKPAAAQ